MAPVVLRYGVWVHFVTGYAQCVARVATRAAAEREARHYQRARGVWLEVNGTVVAFTRPPPEV
jgi:hypothetical protein